MGQLPQTASLDPPLVPILVNRLYVQPKKCRSKPTLLRPKNTCVNTEQALPLLRV